MAKKYNIENLDRKRPGETQEDGGIGRAGLYRHPGSGEEAICLFDPLFGNTQANAFERLGFEWIRDVDASEVKHIVEAPAAQATNDAQRLATLEAQIAALTLGKRNDELQAELDKQAAQRAEGPKSESEVSGDRAKASAASQISLREEVDATVEMTAGGDMVKTDGLTDEQRDKALNDVEASTPENPVEADDEVKEKPLNKMNSTELKEAAAAEGVELTEELDTNKKVAEAIQVKRNENDAKVEGEGEDNKESEQK